MYPKLDLSKEIIPFYYYTKGNDLSSVIHLR
jgi:hypothetical protein